MILFRVDGNKTTGAGHVMRCLSIADHAGSCGVECVFLMASDDMEKNIIGHGHRTVIFHTEYENMLSDLHLTQEWIENMQPVSLIVDSYYVTGGYLSSLKQCCMKSGTTLVYVDDLMAFPYPCDILLNYNIYGPDKRTEYFRMYQDAHMPELLLGPAYAPLRHEFRNPGKREVKRTARNILVSTGGADFGHIGVAFIKAVIRHEEELKDLQFHFVIGSMNGDAGLIRRMAEGVSSIRLHFNVQEMSELMGSCDVAISAAGSTLYELCATQTPTVTYILADNQIPGAEGFERHGIMKCVGDVRQVGVDELVDTFIKESMLLVNDYEKRRRMAEKQRNLVDGEGACRLLEKI